MWNRLAMVVATAVLAGAAPAAAQDIPPQEDPSDPTGCNEYHLTRGTAGTLNGGELQIPDADNRVDLVEADPLFDMIRVMIVWNSEAFPCK